MSQKSALHSNALQHSKIFGSLVHSELRGRKNMYEMPRRYVM